MLVDLGGVLPVQWVRSVHGVCVKMHVELWWPQCSSAPVVGRIVEGGKDAFGLRLQRAVSNVHFQSKSRKVVVDQFHSALQIFGNVKTDDTVEIDAIDQEEKREERLLLTKKTCTFLSIVVQHPHN